MKKNYIQPIIELEEIEEEAVIATSPNYDPEGDGATPEGEDAKKFINFSSDSDWDF